MGHSWVDFKTVKDTVTMAMVLNRYSVNWLRKEKEELVGRCPIHQGDGTRAFHVNPSKNVFNCFSCKARGNVLDFVAAMDKCSVRDAAVKVSAWFSVTTQGPNGQAKPHPVSRVKKAETEVPETGGAVLNKPLSFQLNGIDHTHPYMTGRGLNPETVRLFGVGFFSGRGSMNGRVVIPIHNSLGDLVAYAGRAIDQDAEAKYRFPAGFHKSHELFNLHRVSGGEVVVVEGFFGCMWLSQVFNPCVVALMGSSMSAEQEALLAKFQRVTLLLDGDEPGRGASAEIAARLVHKTYVRTVDPGDGKQPDGLTVEEIAQLFG